MRISPYKGFTVVEIVIAAALLATIVTSAAGAWALYIKVSTQASGRTNAALLAEEAAEVMTILRDLDWTTKIAGLNLETPYYLYWNNGQYVLTTVPTVVSGNYWRTVTLHAVKRDAATFSISPAGVNDPNSRDISISVSFAGSATPLVQSEILLNNVFIE